MQPPALPSLRPDFLRRQLTFGDPRPTERLFAHYVLERQLSDRLRHAPRETRSSLYTEVYRELFAALPDHPQRQRFRGDHLEIAAQLGWVAAGLTPNSVFLDVGCGDAAVAFALAGQVQRVYGLDVTDDLIDFAAAPANFRFLPTAGVEIPLASGEVSLAYSNQLIEHLHPDDASDQLRELYRVLKPGGWYICITPSRVSGPHDISCYFDYSANGLHLREYDYGALRALFRRAGFRSFSCFALLRGRTVWLPYSAVRMLEHVLLALPDRMRARLTQPRPVQVILGLSVMARK